MYDKVFIKGKAVVTLETITQIQNIIMGRKINLLSNIRIILCLTPIISIISTKIRTHLRDKLNFQNKLQLKEKQFMGFPFSSSLVYLTINIINQEKEVSGRAIYLSLKNRQ